MLSKFKNLPLAAFAVAAMALPGVAHAGTSSATGTATMSVVSQCSVSGANIDLGTYLSTDTWATVGSVVGSNVSYTYTAGSRGQEYLNFGSVTCDAGTPYTLSIKGTGPNGAVNVAVNSQVAAFQPAVKRLGGTVVADSDAGFTGVGNIMTSRSLAGTGTAQTVLGSVMISNMAAVGSTMATLTSQLTQKGVFTDTLNYTLTF